MTAARELHLGLDVLDRQLRDRDGRLCGKVDDVELEVDPDTGTLWVAGLVTGGGSLARRLGWRRLGGWLEQFHERFGMQSSPRAQLVPTRLIRSIDAAITLELDADQVASTDLERWTEHHVIGHLPGSRHASE